jgi:tight adherence protein B
MQTTPSAVALISVAPAVAAGAAAMILTHLWFLVPFAAGAAMVVPTMLLMYKRSSRMAAFEEMFPEALDLMSRALKAGHAFQTAVGMAADEMRDPVGPEFRKTFDQQNYGLPLRDALLQMSERVPLLDVRFFVTAVLIQRETGGNLAEILENLAHVVRERFKILRQVRVHTAHGRFTAFVLLALPAFLAVTLYYMNPEHMELLFTDPMGQMMLMATIVLQTIGFFWIRRVIKIEV